MRCVCPDLKQPFLADVRQKPTAKLAIIRLFFKHFRQKLHKGVETLEMQGFIANFAPDFVWRSRVDFISSPRLENLSADGQ
jgi:hypothetical protein